jgi:hypothetical protein
MNKSREIYGDYISQSLTAREGIGDRPATGPPPPRYLPLMTKIPTTHP